MFRFAVLFLAMASVSWVQSAMATGWPNPEESCPAVKQELADILGAWKLAKECGPDFQALHKCCGVKVKGEKVPGRKDIVLVPHNLSRKCISADGPLIFKGQALCDVEHKRVFPRCNRSLGRKAFDWKREAKEALPLAVIFAAVCNK
tara:strand:- start:51 stop:491 length:441 start_codon:yes stop_codon:yes gene_type:complete